MKKLQKNIVVFVVSVPATAEQAVRQLSVKLGRDLEILLIKQTRSKSAAPVAVKQSKADITLECNFSDPDSISAALAPYQDRLLAITCRSESNIARFIKVIPHVPYLRTPSTESLLWASDKYEMRRRLRAYDKKRAINFTLINNSTKKEINRVAEKIGFPMVVKPANLAQSQLVSICYHEEELEKTIKAAFRKIQNIYKVNKRLEDPKIMAEEFVEGDMYSIDSYVDSRGVISHCPLVRVKTGKDIGHDDFYNYLRITPTSLKASTLSAAEEAAESAIHALGLRSTTTHTELIKIDNDWKIVEVGARMGGFRHTLHELSCGINHSMNDILIRIPKKAVIPKKCQGFSATMRYYPSTEGYIHTLVGLKRIKELNSFVECEAKLKVGDRVLFSKNGGKGVFDLTLYNTERHSLLADIRRVEKLVKVKVGTKKLVR